MAGIPTGISLKSLPLRALVAYAARCSRRVMPFFVLPPGHPEAAAGEAAGEFALRLAFDFVSGQPVDQTIAALAEEAVVEALMVISDVESPDTQAALSCNAVYATINATWLSLRSITAPSKATESSKVVAAVITAAEAALVVDPNIRHMMIRDYQYLTRLSLGRFPDWGRPFDATDHGTLGLVQFTREAETAGRRKQLAH